MYSGTLPCSRRRPGARTRLACALALSASLAWPSGAAQGARPEAEASKAEAELKSIATEIELRSAEVSVSRAREVLEDLRRERAVRAARRAALAAHKRELQAELASNRDALAGQLRAAYLIGREEPLKLLLNQKDPARAGRMFVYYSYFGRARASQIRLIEADVHGVEQLDGELEAEDAKLAELEQRQRAELASLEQARSRRTQVLASLEAESHSRAQSLERLRSQQAGLERLLRELRRATEKFPVDGNDAFAHLRGKLAWPVSGRIVARFGESRAGGLKWDGLLVATERGAPVRAVYQGRVIYADWLPGLGLLTIVDHGDGYMSLYGHNERLHKAVGERVAAGDTIASAGDSGGSNRPELYFEIRRSGKPVDPRPWFQAPEP